MKDKDIAIVRKIVAILTAATAIATALANCAEDINHISAQKKDPLELESNNEHF